MIITATNSNTSHVLDGKPYRMCRRGCLHAQPPLDQVPVPDDWLAYFRHECDHSGEVVVDVGGGIGLCTCSAQVEIVKPPR